MNDVYLITNLANGKKYVGITCRGAAVRYQEHLHDAASGKRTALYNAIRKYGPDNFSLSILETDVSDDQASDREMYHIRQQHSLCSEHGYNMTEGGGGIVGYHHLEEPKQRISKSLQGHKFPESRNQKIQAAMTGREYKPEWRAALSASRMGRFTQQDNPFFGKKHSAEAKARVSDHNTKHAVLQLDPHTREVIRKFKNATHASQWVVEQKLTTAKSTTCEGRISEVCRYGTDKSTAYGFGWKYGEGQSTN